jgi:hypothetical protein
LLTRRDRFAVSRRRAAQPSATDLLMNAFGIKAGLCGLSILSSLGATIACSNFESTPQEFGETSEAVRVDDVVMGRGYVENTDDVAGDCLQMPGGAIAGEMTSSTAPGQIVTYNLHRIDSTSQLAEAMQVKASATASFLIASGSGSAEYVNNTETKDTSVLLLAAVEIRNAGYTVHPQVELKPSAATLLRPEAGGSPDRFRELCGDSFISSYSLGGRFFGLIRVDTNSRAEAEEVSAKMSGSFLTFSAEASFEYKVREIVSSARTYITTFQEGGSGPSANPVTDVNSMLQRISSFATAVQAAPIKYDFGTRKYTTLPRPGDGVSPISVQVSMETMRTLQKEFYDATDYGRRVREVELNPAQYQLGSFNIQSAKSAATSATNAYRNALVRCSTDVMNCALPSGVPVLPALPALREGLSFQGNYLISSYYAPSSFITLGSYGNPPYWTCIGSLKATINASSQRQASVFTLLDPHVPGPGARFSLKYGNQFVFGWQSTYGSPCTSGLSTSSFAPTTVSAQELATIELAPAVNGKAGYYSIRGIEAATPCSPGGPCMTSKSNRYLVWRNTSATDKHVVFETIPGSPTSTWKDQASWGFTKLP